MKGARTEEGTDLRVAGLQEGEELLRDLDAAKIEGSEGLTDDPGLLEGAQGGVHEDHPTPPDATKAAFSGELFQGKRLDSDLHTRLFGEVRESDDRLLPAHRVIVAPSLCRRNFTAFFLGLRPISES
jgi:hypothetical protein